jgi:hypothetical protein
MIYTVEYIETIKGIRYNRQKQFFTLEECRNFLKENVFYNPDTFFQRITFQ